MTGYQQPRHSHAGAIIDRQQNCLRFYTRKQERAFLNTSVQQFFHHQLPLATLLEQTSNHKVWQRIFSDLGRGFSSVNFVTPYSNQVSRIQAIADLENLFYAFKFFNEIEYQDLIAAVLNSSFWQKRKQEGNGAILKQDSGAGTSYPHFRQYRQQQLMERIVSAHYQANFSIVESAFTELFSSEIWKNCRIRQPGGLVEKMEEINTGLTDLRLLTKICRIAAMYDRCQNNRWSKQQIIEFFFGRGMISKIGSGPWLRSFADRQWHRFYPDVVLTSYFTGKPDPGGKEEAHIPRNHFSYIEPWYDSIRHLKAHGVIFYDNLSEDFIARYSTDRIKFVKAELGKLNINDERFILYFYFLLKNRYRSVFLTDITDVVVNRHPACLLSGQGDLRIFVGRDRYNLVDYCTWMQQMTESFERRLGITVDSGFYGVPLYNAGIIGGTLQVVFFVLYLMTMYFLKLNSEIEHDMMVLTYILYYYFGNIPSIGGNINTSLEVVAANDQHSSTPFIFSGFPLCSEFFKCQYSSDACLIHK